LWNADFVPHSIRTRARTRRRPRRCFSAYDFEDEDDDKDDDNTLHKANFNPRLDYGFFVLNVSHECSGLKLQISPQLKPINN